MPDSDEIIYFRRYLNDAAIIVSTANSQVTTASTGTTADETYYRRYLNDI